LELLPSLTDAINAVWEKRHKLLVVTARKRAPRHLDIWELRPRTNCKQCGEATCLAFAIILLQQERELVEYFPSQQASAFTDRKATLEAML
jgi:ArsR family metal-binding transcriptional regulator